MSSYPQRSDQMLEEENERLENNLSNKVQALKSVRFELANWFYKSLRGIIYHHNFWLVKGDTSFSLIAWINGFYKIHW